DPPGVDVFAAVGDETPWLIFAIVPRDEVSWESRRQRCALGLPLLGGTSLPIVDRVTPEQTFHPPEADDLRLALAVAEAILATPREEVLAVAGAPRVFKHHVEVDAGAVEVRLTASPAEAPWDDEEEGEGETGIDEEEGIDEEDEEDEGASGAI